MKQKLTDDEEGEIGNTINSMNQRSAELKIHEHSFNLPILLIIVLFMRFDSCFFSDRIGICLATVVNVLFPCDITVIAYLCGEKINLVTKWKCVCFGLYIKILYQK